MTPEEAPSYYIPMTKPQDVYDGHKRDNFFLPFVHVWLERKSNDTSYVHPLEKFPELEFIEQNLGCIEPVKPLPLEETPFTLVEDVKELKLLVEKLKLVDEFAVDLEHNIYRTFQGLTCLMQISTRREDFVVDTLKLHIHVGPHLRAIFQDPGKKKVMHGAINDILWLQRDFGIYVCNLFDTHEALKELKASGLLVLDKNSLECLLHHYCGITVNKAYQESDWRLRPLTDTMINYAREDTHYLLYIHDLMSRELQTAPTDANDQNKLFKVYKESSKLCKTLYAKKLFTDTSYLWTKGLPDADLNSQQLSVVAALCEFRDWLARAEDESTGYILPNKIVIKIARRMPRTVSEVLQCVKPKESHFDIDPSIIVELVETSLHDAPAYEYAVQFLKWRREEMRTTSCEQGTTGGSRMSNEEKDIKTKGEGTNCLSASEHANKEYSCLQQRSDGTIHRKTATWLEGIGYYSCNICSNILLCSTCRHAPRFQLAGVSSVEESTERVVSNEESKSPTSKQECTERAVKNEETKSSASEEDSTERIVSNEENESSTSDQESTEPSSSRGSSEKSRREEDVTSDCPKESGANLVKSGCRRTMGVIAFSSLLLIFFTLLYYYFF